MPDDSHGHPLRRDPLHEMRILKWWIRLVIYSSVALLVPGSHFLLGMPWLQATIKNLGGGCIIATLGIEFGFVWAFKLCKRAAYPSMLTVELAAEHDLNQACRRGVETVGRWLGAKAAVLACLHRGKIGLEAVASYGLPPGWLCSEPHSWSELDPFVEAIQRERVITRALGSGEIWSHRFDGSSCVAYVPVVSLDKVIGVLGLVGGKEVSELRDERLLTAIGLTLGLTLDNIRLYDHEYQSMLHILCSALDLRDRVTEDHSRRVAELSLAVAKQLGIDSECLIDLERGAILHDIGKITLPDAILSKPGPLTLSEWEEMHKHPVVGYQMVREVPFLSGAADVIYTHHERFDGTGYPCGLRGEQIPLGARIFAVVDAYDAITSDRPYRKASRQEYALEEIRRNMGTQFDPKVVEAFLKAAEKGLVHDGSSPVPGEPLPQFLAHVLRP